MTMELPLSSRESAGWVELPFSHPAWLTLRSAGDMRLPERRAEVFAAIGLPGERVCMLSQIHSRTVHDADQLVAKGSTAAGEVRVEGDGMVSGPGGPYLAVGVGDCLPILLADERIGAYAALHSGWRGTGILEEAVARMGERWGSVPQDIVALFGPCISAESYVVDEARAREYRVWGAGAVVRRDDRAYLDMRSANLGIAARLGIGSVIVADHCTFRTPQLGSYRREGRSGYTGMLAIVGPRSLVKEGKNE